MQITSELRLTFPVTWTVDGEPLIWAYHQPISREVFQQNWRIIAATKNDLLAKGTRYAFNEGPQLASLAFADAAAADAAENGTPDAGKALLADLKRLTFILAPTPAGHELWPAEVAIARETITAEDWADAESALVFFTCFYAMATRIDRVRKAEAAALALMGSTTSLGVSEWAASLQTSTLAETSSPAADSAATTIPQ